MIIYLHGRRTTGLNGNAVLFKEYFEDEVFTPSMSHIPNLAIDTLEQIIEIILSKNENIGLVGSSMGGYYAMYLADKYDLKAVLINPAIVPYTNYSRIGMYSTNYDNSSYEITKSHLDNLKNYEVENLKKPKNFLTLLQTGDEVLDYTIAQEKLKNTELIVEEGGCHSFENIESYFRKIGKFLEM